MKTKPYRIAKQTKYINYNNSVSSIEEYMARPKIHRILDNKPEESSLDFMGKSQPPKIIREFEKIEFDSPFFSRKYKKKRRSDAFTLYNIEFILSSNDITNTIIERGPEIYAP